MKRPRRDAGGRPILIASAFEPELEPLRRLLHDAGVGDRDVACVSVGIGAVEAAIGSTRAILAVMPRLAIFLGTAGAYGARPEIGRAVIARRLTLASTAVARGDGYLPAPLPLHAATDDSLRARLQRAARALSDGAAVRDRGTGPAAVDVACPLAITRTLALGRRLEKATAAAAENLEAFAVGRAATTAGLPFGAVLGISNRVGPDAHAEWRRYQTAATAAATAVVFEFILTSLVGRVP